VTEAAGDAGKPTSADVADTLRLALTSGVGPRLRRLLLARFGTSTAALDAPLSELREVPGVGAKLSQAIHRARSEVDVENQLALCREHGLRVLTESDCDYPRNLREIPDPPAVLFVRGQLLPRDALAVAIVGSRHGTQYGRVQAERLAASLARAGLTIVSGLARGIDGVAHRAALDAGGRTLAVLGSGLLNIYPSEHCDLAADVAGSGAVLSEFPLGAAPLAGAFPQRNRIISGLSLGVIVVEAADRSGALVTARHAVEQSREVFALPGRVDSRMSRGCHRLIRDGAALVETADDVLEALGPLVERAPVSEDRVVHHPAELLLNEVEQQVLGAVESEPTSIDEVVRATALPAPVVLSTISILEMRRLVRRVSGVLVARV
jgi:DNA processing protein